jgi:hypothetical protein
MCACQSKDLLGLASEVGVGDLGLGSPEDMLAWACCWASRRVRRRSSSRKCFMLTYNDNKQCA